jgi:two-component sensor histidine kinase/putative methionine-R-sulfoxide reductase with GAF domain
VSVDPDHFTRIEEQSSQSIHSLLAIPLLAEERAIGVLTAINKRQGQFSEQDQTVLTTMANHAAIAIENARLFERARHEIEQRLQAEAALEALNATLEERIRQRTFDLQVLHDLSREIGNVRDADAFMRLILSNIASAFDHDVAASVVVTGDSCKLFVQPVRPVASAVLEEMRERLATAFRALSGKKLDLKPEQFLVGDGMPDGADTERPIVRGLASVLQVPLVVKEEGAILGLLLIGAEQDEAFSESHVRLLYTIASQTSLYLAVRQSEQQLRAALQEKEVLLKEIHHRVKNNLQVVSSLLKLQSQYCDDPQTLDAFRESQNRVKSMALVHERLYRSSDMARIDFGDYIRSLARDLFRSYNAHVSGITLEVEAVDGVLDIDRATPCGLITNEIISNALKHAFPDGQAGQISVGLERSEDVFTLSVKDNGVGFAQDLDFTKTDSLGLKLIHTLVRQLKGTLEVHRHSGTEFEIRFPAHNQGKARA